MHYEDFEVGRTFETRSRTVTGTDVDLFTAMTGATNPLFTSDEHARSLGHAGRLVPGPLLVSLVFGLAYQTGIFDRVLALAGIEGLRFLSPFSPGKGLRARIEVVEKRATKDPTRGLVVLAIEAAGPEAERKVLQGRFVFVVARS